jgi:hypothetical protein
VLLERDPDPGRVRMYILSSQTDQAVIAIERIEDRRDPDVDRSLALKVRNAYDVVGYVNSTRAAAPTALSAALATPPQSGAAPAPVVVVPETVALWAVLVDAGAGLALGNGARVVSSFGLGLGHVRQERRLELVLGARLYSERSAHDGAARLRMTERGPFVAGRWLWRRGRVELGALLEAQLSVVKAEGSAVDGRRHTRTLLTPLVNLGPELRVRLFASAYLRLAPSLELPLVRRRLAVEEQVLIEDRPLRGSVALSLVVLLPLRRAPESFQP